MTSCLYLLQNLKSPKLACEVRVKKQGALLYHVGSVMTAGFMHRNNFHINLFEYHGEKGFKSLVSLVKQSIV